MGFIDKLLGREAAGPSPRPASPRVAATDDERAVERYRYLVRTAPPDRIEEAHREAFERLTPEQRQIALQELSGSLPDGERPTSDEPQALARAATRAEMREPGSVERAFGRSGGFGGMSMLNVFATAFIGTLAAQALFAELGDDGGSDGDADAGADDGSGGDAGGDAGGGDWGGGDFGGGDFGM